MQVWKSRVSRAGRPWESYLRVLLNELDIVGLKFPEKVYYIQIRWSVLVIWGGFWATMGAFNPEFFWTNPTDIDDPKFPENVYYIQKGWSLLACPCNYWTNSKGAIMTRRSTSQVADLRLSLSKSDGRIPDILNGDSSNYWMNNDT